MLSSDQYDKGRELAIWECPERIDVARLLFWSWYEPRNFGDWIGPYLHEAITGHRPLFCPKERMSRFGCIMAVGSILRHLVEENCVVVWGSGIISASDMLRRPKEVLAVRGPLTRRRLLELGYECPEIYGDPAMLLPRFYRPERSLRASSIGFIPHFVDRHLFSSREDFRVIDPTGPVDRVIEEIVTCRLTFSSSLHGLIVSHAYGVPAVWVRPVNRIDGDDSKFRDYFLSLGLDPQPVTLRGCDAVELAARDRSATLPNHAPLLDPLARSCPFCTMNGAAAGKT